WETETRNKYHQFPLKEEKGSELFFSENNQFICAKWEDSSSGALEVVDLNTKASAYDSGLGKLKPFSHVVFSEENRSALIIHPNGGFDLKELGTGKHINTQPGVNKRSNYIDWKGGRFAAMSFNDGTVRVLDTKEILERMEWEDE